jgi:hypothetical protein
MACSADQRLEDTDPIGGAGAGGEAGSGGAGAGGENGGSGGEQPDPCSVCGEHDVCFEDQCYDPRGQVWITVQYDDLADFATDLDPYREEFYPEGLAFAYGTLWTSEAATWTPNVTATDGDCYVEKPTASWPYSQYAWDVGTITVESSTGALTLVESSAPPWVAPPAGETVLFGLSGGAHVPASSFDLVARAMPVVTSAEPAVRGEPMTLTWEPGSPGDTIYVHAYAYAIDLDGISIICETPDDGSLTIAGSLTAELEHMSSLYVAVGMNRKSEQTLTAGAIDVTATVGIERLVVVDYVP